MNKKAPPPINTNLPYKEESAILTKNKKPKFNLQDYVTMTLSIEDVKDLKMTFDVFDGDLSGQIDPSQLKQAFLDLGFSSQNKLVYQILAQLDDNESGGIDFGEFIKLATDKSGEKQSRADVDKLFKFFDSSNSGRITVAQVKKVAKQFGQSMTEEQIQKLFEKADLDGDQYLTAEDFYNIVTHKVYWGQ